MFRKIFAIGFLCLLALNTSIGIQLIKIPLLISHYQEHKVRNADVTFLAFLKMHYLEEQNRNTDQDYDRDMQLPFKSISLNNISLLIFVNPSLPLNIPFLGIPSAEHFPVVQEQLVSLAPINSIWQPPKSI